MRTTTPRRRVLLTTGLLALGLGAGVATLGAYPAAANPADTAAASAAAGDAGEAASGAPEEVGPCPAVENLTVSEITEISAVLTWTLPEGSDRYQSYARVSGAPWWDPIGSDLPNTSAWVEGLIPGTEQHISVGFFCKDQRPALSVASVDFTTPGVKPDPTENNYAAYATAAGGSSAASNGDASGAGEAGDITGTEAGATANTVTAAATVAASANGTATAAAPEADIASAALTTAESAPVAQSRVDTLAATGMGVNALTIGGLTASLVGLGLIAATRRRRTASKNS